MLSRTISGLVAFNSLTLTPILYQSARRPRYKFVLCKLSFVFNIMRSRTSSARDAFRSLLHSTLSYTSLHGSRATKLFVCGLRFFLIFCPQERAVRGTHLGPSCTQPHHITLCTEAALPICTVVVFILFNIMRSKTGSARVAFRSLLHSPYPIPLCTEAGLYLLFIAIKYRF